MEYKRFHDTNIRLNGPQTSSDAERELKKANFFYTGKFIFIAILCFVLYNTGSSWLGKIIKTIYTEKSAIGVKYPQCRMKTFVQILLYEKENGQS